MADPISFNIQYDNQPSQWTGDGENNTKWFGQSHYNENDDPSGPSCRNKMRIDISSTNCQLKNISQMSISLQYFIQPRIYTNDSGSGINRIYGYRHLLLFAKSNTIPSNFNLFWSRQSNDTISSDNTNFLYDGDTITNFELDGILDGGATVYTNTDNDITINDSKDYICILFKPANLSPSRIQTTNFTFHLPKTQFNLENSDYSLIIAGALFQSFSWASRYQNNPNTAAALQLTNPDALPIELIGEPIGPETTKIKIPASWTGDIIYGNQNDIKDFHRLNQVLLDLSSEEFGWKKFNYTTTIPTSKPTVGTPITFATGNYGAPLKKIYDLCAGKTTTACQAVRNLGNPQQFFIIPKLNVYYDALKEMYSECFEEE